jgi:acetate kinase
LALAELNARMRILVVNAGSSSMKLSILGDGDDIESETEIDGWDGDAGAPGIASFLRGAGHVDAVGHRVVHGGERFTAAAVVDDEVERAIGDLGALAPLHQARAVAGIDAARRTLGDVCQVACFDTAFHATMPAAATTYALPAEWRSRWPLRRFGFHGLSHAYAQRRAVELAGSPLSRIVTCHLGAGASLCAVHDGNSVATTMGFTPLEGLVMATRSGTVDPGLVTWLVREGGVPVDEVDDALSHRSGLAGLAGNGDMREVVARQARGDKDATLAFDVYVHRLREEIAAMTASLGGLDALVFTGGVGEHSSPVRAAAAAGLSYLGVEVDATANEAAHGDADITAPEASTARTLVVTAREDIEIARQVRGVLAAR